MSSDKGAFSSSVTEEEKKLSFEDKLALIDDEIQTLYSMCVKSGFSPKQIEKCAHPLLEPAVKDQRRRLMNWALLIGFILVAAYALFYYDSQIRKATYATVRLASIKLLPYWDWTNKYDDLCLVPNPYYKPKDDVDVCLDCENLTVIDKLSKVDTRNITENYIYHYTPFIVTDALTAWPAYEKFNLEFFNELYQTNEILMNDKPCFVKSNIRLKPGQHRDLLKKSAAGKVDNWFMFWENCNMNATKVFRKFCRRPYFLPNSIEATGISWILTVKNFEAKNYKMLLREDYITWFAQVRGKTMVNLIPVPQ